MEKVINPNNVSMCSEMQKFLIDKGLLFDAIRDYQFIYGCDNKKHVYIEDFDCFIFILKGNMAIDTNHYTHLGRKFNEYKYKKEMEILCAL